MRWFDERSLGSTIGRPFAAVVVLVDVAGIVVFAAVVLLRVLLGVDVGEQRRLLRCVDQGSLDAAVRSWRW